MEEWTDRDGKQRHTLEVHATEMQFIGGGKNDSAEGSKGHTGEAAALSAEPTDLIEDDVPF